MLACARGGEDGRDLVVTSQSLIWPGRKPLPMCLRRWRTCTPENRIFTWWENSCSEGNPVDDGMCRSNEVGHFEDSVRKKSRPPSKKRVCANFYTVGVKMCWMFRSSDRSGRSKKLIFFIYQSERGGHWILWARMAKGKYTGNTCWHEHDARRTQPASIFFPYSSRSLPIVVALCDISDHAGDYSLCTTAVFRAFSGSGDCSLWRCGPVVMKIFQVNLQG
jgi:hypothetical protein